MHRFFLQQDIPESGNLILHEKPLMHQMSAVLKLKAGESVILFNGSGRDFEFRIAKISPQAVFGHITKVSLNKRDPILQIHLYQAMIKKNNFEWVLQKCTELGVKTFIPILSERSIKKGLNRERAEKIVREAVEQSGQDIIPSITDPISFSEAINRIGRGETIILCDQSGTLLPNERFFEGKLIHIFVGPEGGYSEKEINAVREHGGMVLSLGQRVLRAETASVAVVSLALALIFKQ
ncbi:MAG: RsmE family RNA methyltransferase [bacterium]|nr:RsmE family RNA methyltransferase [bacterium]